MKKAQKDLLYSQTYVLFFITICFLLKPDEFSKNAALSYYGTIGRTIIPYSLGIMSVSIFLFKAAFNLKKDGLERKIGSVLKTVAILLIGELIFPYSLNGAFFAIHLAIGGTLFLVALLTTLYIIFYIDKSWRNLLILVAEITAMTVLALSTGFINLIHFQAISQLILNFAFVFLLFNTLRESETITKPKSPGFGVK